MFLAAKEILRAVRANISPLELARWLVSCRASGIAKNRHPPRSVRWEVADSVSLPQSLELQPVTLAASMSIFLRCYRGCRSELEGLT